MAAPRRPDRGTPTNSGIRNPSVHAAWFTPPVSRRVGRTRALRMQAPRRRTMSGECSAGLRIGSISTISIRAITAMGSPSRVNGTTRAGSPSASVELVYPAGDMIILLVPLIVKTRDAPPSPAARGDA